MEMVTWKDVVVFIILPLVPLVLGFGLRSFTKRVEAKSDAMKENSTIMHAETMNHLGTIQEDVRENRKEIKETRREIGNHIKDHAKGVLNG